MSQRPPGGDEAPEATHKAPHCVLCGAEERPSHREYRGHGNEAMVWRCSGCGSTRRGEDRPAETRTHAKIRSRKPLPAEGSPDNPVLNADAAARLRALFEGSDS